jgi:cobalt-zinc-cadmium resistance protein CzcA
MKTYETILRYRYVLLFLFLLAAAFGWKAYKEIPVDAFPDITPKQVIIYTESPGNPPELIEKLVTYPIESAMAGLPGVKLILSNSIFGLSYVAIFFEEDYDIYFLRQLVSERLQNIQIPKELGTPQMGPNTTGLGQVFWYMVDGNESLRELRSLQEYLIAPALKSVKGVEEVVSWGGFEKIYEVEIDPIKLAAAKLTYGDVLKALLDANKATGGGYLEMNKEQYLIRFDALYKSIEDIKNSVVKSAEGVVTLKDVAKVKVSDAPRFGAVTYNGKEVVFGMVLQRSGTNAAKVVERLKEQLPKIESALPKGVRIVPLYDRSEITQKAMRTMTNALQSGILLVAIVLILFLFEFRTAFIVILSLPFSLALAFLFMKWYGVGLNLMSLSGIAIAIGMIVDATIVVVENSYRLINEKRRNDFTLIAHALRQVSKPVFFAIAVIVATFAPLLFLGSLAGKLYAPMALGIIFALLSSILVALLFAPALSSFLLRPSKRGSSPFFNVVLRAYEPLLEGVLRARVLIVALAFGALVFLGWKVSQRGMEFMPKLNEESIMYRVIAIPGTALSQSTQLSRELEEYILGKYPQVEGVLSMIGRSEKGETAQSNYMEVLLLLKKYSKDLEEKITKDLKKRFDYVQFVPTQPIAMRIEELLEGVKAELAVKIFGEDQKVLSRLSKSIAEILHKVKGLEEVEVESQLGQSQIVIEPDFVKMAIAGITPAELARYVRHLVAKAPVTQKFEGVRRYGVVASVKADSIEKIKNLLIRSNNGKLVRLKDVANIEVLQESSFIKRENLQRYALVSFEVEGRDIASFVKEADTLINESVDFPAGYFIRWAGDFKNMQAALQRFAIIIPLTLVGIFVLLYMAFLDFKKAFVIFIGVPLSLIGSFVAVEISGIYLSVATIVGFIVIFAIAVLNGVVLVSFLEELDIQDPKELVKRAALLRLRPVLMTASTTFFGILPLLWATGVGSEIQYPLAVVVIGGIVSSTFVTLLILPALLLLLKRSSNF